MLLVKCHRTTASHNSIFVDIGVNAIRMTPNQSSMRPKGMFLYYFLASFVFASVADAFQSEVKAQPVSLEIKQGTVVTETLVSTILRENKVGLDPNRKVKIYLPSDYFSS